MKKSAINSFNQAFNEIRANPPDLLNLNNMQGEFLYLKQLEPSYRRTFTLADTLVAEGSSICELGSYLGIISYSLTLAGHAVDACDIPSYYSNSSVKNYFLTKGVNTHSFNLRDYKIPFEDNRYDLLICCEVLEHLNFNPLPILQEINRILKMNAYLYIGIPNSANLLNRFRAFFSGRYPGLS